MGRLRLRVKELAEEQGFNITTLAEAADVNWRTVQKLWHNEARQLNTETLAKVAKALGTPTKDLLVEED